MNAEHDDEAGEEARRTPRRGLLRAAPYWVGVAFGLALLALALFAPSTRPHTDGFDELTALASPTVGVVWKHPLSEPVLWSTLHALGVYRAPTSLRAVQLYNAVWSILALLCLYAIGIRRRLGVRLALGSALVVAMTFSALHFLRDPFLYYWPPSLAFLGLETLVATTPGAPRLSRAARVVVCALLGAVAVGFNPMVAPAAAAALVLLIPRERAPRWKIVVGSAVPLMLALLPILAVRYVRAVRRVDPIVGVVYGIWKPYAAQISWGAFREALVASPSGDGAAAALVASVLARLAFAGLGLLALLAFIRSQLLHRCSAFFAAAVGLAIFVAWWDPGQPYFWFLVPYLLALALASCAAPSQRLGRVLERASLLTAALSAVANLVVYVLPTARGVDPKAKLAQELARRLSNNDRIVFAQVGDPSLEYYGGVHSTGFLELYLDRAPGETTFARFVRLYDSVSAEHGRLYVHTERDGTIPDLPADLEPAELARVGFGITLRLGDFDLREVTDILPSAPCAIAREKGTQTRFGRVAASSFTESEQNRVYAPELAFDGRSETEWLSLDARAWLDLYVDPPRALESIRLLNAANAPYLDHATRSYVLEAWHEGVLVARRAGRFDGTPPARVWQRSEWPNQPVDCVRFTASGRYRRGVGLAELVVSP